MAADPSEHCELVALIGLVTSRARRDAAERSLDELAGLVRAAGGRVILTALQERDRPDPSTFFGRGKLAELAVACDEQSVDLVVCDHELTPAQASHVEPILGRRVIDRTQVILDIFARRARTREGKWQVELAQLQYLLPRLAGSGAALSRLGGGIGTRGPGETKLETDRRRIRQRITNVKTAIEEVRSRRARLRGRRKRAEAPTVALVGYTNAGKTTLFNRLTREQAVASDALFVTLDPLVRRLALPDAREVLVSDTVGFIDRLPHALVAAFRATLEEVAESDVIVHVRDAAAPDRTRREAAVQAVLDEVDASHVPVIDVFTKADLLDAEARAALALRHPSAVVVSAVDGGGCDALIDRLLTITGSDEQLAQFRLDIDTPAGRDALSRIYRHGRVVTQTTSGRKTDIEVILPRGAIAAIESAAARSCVRGTPSVVGE